MVGRYRYGTVRPLTNEDFAKHFILAAALTASLVWPWPKPRPPRAFRPKVKTAQQSKMAACNEQAGDKKGAEREGLHEGVLSAKAPARRLRLGQDGPAEKMKTCNADAKAKNLAGAERKAFMKECLSAK
jgi:hypothetical protein